MGLEEQLLVAAIRETINDARTVLHEVIDLAMAKAVQSVDDIDAHMALDERSEALGYYVAKIFREVQILAERLTLPSYRNDIERNRAEFASLSELDIDLNHDFYCPALNRAIDHFRSLETMVLGREVTGLGVFQTMLEHTPQIILAKGIEPASEAEVRAAIRETLGFAFRDVVKEIDLPKITKTYKADIGVRSLMAVAEYKFATTRAAAKAHLGEVYADMKGYAGSLEWRSFYAVLYQTEPWFHQKDVEAEFAIVKAELNWTPIVVTGHGKRK